MDTGGSGESFLGMIRRPDGIEAESMGADLHELPKEAPPPPVAEVMEDLGSEDDIDVQAKFFVAVNVRSGHRKLHVWGRCGTKPGENFAAHEPHNSLGGVQFSSLCGHCWRKRDRQELEESSTTTSASDMD